MQRGRVVDLTVQRALDAAALSLRHSLPMADSLILAAAREHGATVWTLADFRGLQDVRSLGTE
jgi:predicted nucleic acid-binding protein